MLGEVTSEETIKIKEEDMGSINDGGDDDDGTSRGGIHMMKT